MLKLTGQQDGTNNFQFHSKRECPHLGIEYLNKLDYSHQIENKCRKASMRSAYILRTIKSKDYVTQASIHHLPIIDLYCTVVWSPHLKQHIEIIEQVQRHFTEQVRKRAGLQLTHEERLQLLELFELDARRKTADSLMTFKILKRLTSIDSCFMFLFNNQVYSQY